MAVELQNAAESSSTSTSTFKKATVYLNVGYTVVMGDGTETFVSLPFGLGLDNMSQAKTDSSNEDYNALNAARNQLLADILQAAKGISPGNGKFLDGLKLELRVKSKPADTSEGINPFIRKNTFTMH